jgi:hypothetical protein
VDLPALEMKTLKLVGAAQIAAALHEAFADRVIPGEELGARLVIADTTYVGVPVQFVRQIARADPNLRPTAYRADLFDCDDYVQYLKICLSLYAVHRGLPAPLAVGFLITSDHAFNLFFDPAGALHLLDTQSPQRVVESRGDSFAKFLRISASNRLLSIYI